MSDDYIDRKLKRYYGQQVTLPLVRQADFDDYPVLKRWGCRFLHLLAFPQIYLNTVLTKQQIIEIFEKLSKNPLIVEPKEAACGTQEHIIINTGFQYLGSNETGIQVGVLNYDGKSLYFHTNKHNFSLLHWKTQGIDGHFTCGDKNGKEIWDGLYQTGIQKSYIRRTLLYRIGII